MLLSFFMHFYYWYAATNVLNYPASGENQDSGVAYFKNPLIHIPPSVENQDVAKYKSDIQMYKNS